MQQFITGLPKPLEICGTPCLPRWQHQISSVGSSASLALCTKTPWLWKMELGCLWPVAWTLSLDEVCYLTPTLEIQQKKILCSPETGQFVESDKFEVLP